MPDDIRIRSANYGDGDFIARMGYLAAFPFANGSNPTFEEAMEVERLKPYIRDFGRKEGDFGLIAEDASGQSIGAAWYRFYERAAESPVPTTELSIAVREEAQGRGIGEKLLSALIACARSRAVEELGLHVVSRNLKAKALYDKLGFSAIAGAPEGVELMVISLAVR